MAANQTVVSGGRREVSGTLHFEGFDPDTTRPKLTSLPVTLYDAEIGIHVILSYEWLANGVLE